MQPILTIGNLITLMKEQLDDVYPSGELNSITNIILQGYLGKSRLFIRTNRDFEIPRHLIPKITDAIEKLKGHVPVQYILGKAWFCDMEFSVNEHVLIPRQETAELIGWIMDTGIAAIRHPGIRILDIGTGSGCIAITLKKKIPSATVVAIDVSGEALKTAQINARYLGADIELYQRDIFQPDSLTPLGTFDLVVSNPPYVLQSDKQWMQKNVLLHEPANALFVDDQHPLVHYEAIAAFARYQLLPEGSLYVEIHEKMGSRLADLFMDEGYTGIEIRKDIHGKDRMMRIRR